MSIMERLKKLAPKTPKQWAIAAAGGTGLVLLGNYVYVKDKDSSYVMRLWHKLHGGGALPHPHAPRLPPHRPSPAHQAPPARPPVQQPMAMPSMQQPMQPMMQPIMVQQEYLVEPFYAPGYDPGSGYSHHYGFHSPYGRYGHEFSHMPYGRHHVGVDPNEQNIPPVTPPPTRTKVPPPGARGIVRRTTPAPTDPQTATTGDFGVGAQESPCGPGLWFNPATGACVPYPSTGPVAGEWE